jgi:hypothetical protein
MGFHGFCARSRRVSALAERLRLLVYNLWSLFVRLLEPCRHGEAAGSGRSVLVVAARLVASAREKALLVRPRPLVGATQGPGRKRKTRRRTGGLFRQTFLRINPLSESPR